jgi:hypothetical protein
MSLHVRSLKSLMIVCAAVIGVFASMGGANADLIPGQTVTVEWAGVPSGATTEVIHIGSSTVNVYTGPYNLNVGGVQGLWMCFDAGVYVQTTPPWTSLVATTATTASDYFTTPSGGTPSDVALVKSEMIAYLSSQWVSTSTKQDLEYLQLAMWEVTADFKGNETDLKAATGSFYLFDAASIIAVDALLASAYDAVATGNYESTFLLPVSNCPAGVDVSTCPDVQIYAKTQPFVGPGHAVPDNPATLLLLGLCIPALGVMARRWLPRG